MKETTIPHLRDSSKIMKETTIPHLLWFRSWFYNCSAGEV
jgi:hypothetical protein